MLMYTMNTCSGCPCRCPTIKVGQYYDIIIDRDLKCHDNRYGRKIFSIAISSIQYYHKYRHYHKIRCPETCTSVKCFHLIFTILVAVVLLSDIMNINHCNNYSHDTP